MPSGGVLEVTLQNVSVSEPPTITVGKLEPGDWVCLTVVDTGIGMSADLKKIIFEPFFTANRVEHGTGIGLAVVGNIVSSMGGAISVSSEPGRGSAFRVYWPAITKKAEKIVELKKDFPGGNGEAIMVIDDDPALVGVAEELLAALGYEPVGYTDSKIALAALHRDPKRFDAILSDENMPGMRGTELARNVRESGIDIPILLMTGHRDAGLAERAQAIDVVDVLDKPLRGEQLGSVFGRVFAKLD
jgi:CheY-like chemotaxis protein